MWRGAKVWRTIRLGPVSVFYRLGRTVPISQSGSWRAGRRLQESLTFWRGSEVRDGLPPAALPRHERVHIEPAAREQTALIVGVGPGLGYAVARRLSGAGMRVALVSRNAEKLAPLVEDLTKGRGNAARAYGCDATSESSVKKMMTSVCQEIGAPDLVIYGVQGFGPGRTVDVEVPAFEESWRQNCLGAFIVAREAARRMIPLHRGTIILTGSPSSLAGRAEHLNLAVGKFGLRALAQVMARELWPEGIHVAHLIIDADIRNPAKPEEPGEPKSEPQHIAEQIFAIHQQPKSAWTHELDIRPCNESFWEHC